MKELFLEDFEKVVSAIQSLLAKIVYFLAKTNQLLNIRAGEWITTIAMSTISPNRGAGVLLGICFACKLSFLDHGPIENSLKV